MLQIRELPVLQQTCIILDSYANSYFTFDMALRVLLADESSTIKKVMQLALSDFAVEVKAVPVGLDVLSVTKDFKPDIIFADVLLTKRSGYDVCLDLKADPITSQIPVVLMWSGFMEIDEERVRSSRADRRLEKPFDADHLRSLVQDLVQKTKSNPVSSFLSFPEMPDFAEEELSPGGGSPNSLEPLQNLAPQSSIHTTEEDSFLNIPDLGSNVDLPLEIPGEEFSAVPLTTPKLREESEEEGGWAHQDLSKFKIQIPETETEDFASKFVIPQDQMSAVQMESESEFEEVRFGEELSGSADLAQQKSSSVVKPALIAKTEKSVQEQMLQTLQKGVNAKPNTQSKIDLDSNMMEKMIREEAREVIESVCWRVLPEIAERIVREELNKILRETEKSI